MTQLPVKLTDPLTAILYITADRTHMLEMKDALHLRQVAEGEGLSSHSLYGGLVQLGRTLGAAMSSFVLDTIMCFTRQSWFAEVVVYTSQILWTQTDMLVLHLHAAVSLVIIHA